MIDIDAEFRKAFGLQSSTANTEETTTISAEDLLADMKRIQAKLGPPPPRVQVSKHAPVFVDAKPSAEPRTDDMRAMCDDLGQQKVPGALFLDTSFLPLGGGTVLFINPVNIKDKDDD